jgi:hypothetical protein
VALRTTPDLPEELLIKAMRVSRMDWLISEGLIVTNKKGAE